jgi:hypothetical protein
MWAVRGALAAVILSAAGCGGSGSPETTGDGELLLAAGDIAECETQGDEATAAIVAEYPEAAVATLGDNAYQQGTPEQFDECYDPSWGAHKDRTYPSPGNHDYSTEDAAGYYGYFGDVASPPHGYYSYTLGDWQIISLNSECRRDSVGGCDRDDPQAEWLAEELERSAARCTLAYWHHPPFTSGRYRDGFRNLERARILWEILYEADADVVLVGHEHSYERFAPMNADGDREAGGMRLFVVGTGGGNLRDYEDPPLPTTEVRDDTSLGLLKLTLLPDRYDWEFVPVEGAEFADTGSALCR